MVLGRTWASCSKLANLGATYAADQSQRRGVAAVLLVHPDSLNRLTKSLAPAGHDVVIVGVLIRPLACPSACVDRGHPRIGANEDLAIPESR